MFKLGGMAFCLLRFTPYGHDVNLHSSGDDFAWEVSPYGQVKDVINFLQH